MTNPQLHDAIETLKRDFGDRIPNHLDLRRLARAQSVDFAALFFADQLLSLDRNAAINRRFRVQLDRAVRNEAIVADSDDVVVALVPGYDYKKTGYATGADLQDQVAILGKLGLRVEFIDVDPIGTVLEGADVIEEALERLGEEQVVVAGPSSAGPAIHTALSRLGPGSGSLRGSISEARFAVFRCSTGFRKFRSAWCSTLSSGRRIGDATASRA